MLRKFAFLTVALTLAIPAAADTPSKSPMHKTSTVAAKPGKLQGNTPNHHKTPATNNGKPAPCIPPGFDLQTNGRPCK
jgi:hypothetical protein